MNKTHLFKRNKDKVEYMDDFSFFGDFRNTKQPNLRNQGGIKGVWNMGYGYIQLAQVTPCYGLPESKAKTTFYQGNFLPCLTMEVTN